MKERRSVGWWPSSVPAAARRVSWWPRSLPPPEPPPPRPSSLVIVHCGPSTSSQQSPTTPPVVQRPSCSPPPPPPRSPAASSYATADEDDSPSPLEIPPQSADGDLLQGILAIIEKKGNITTADCADDIEESTTIIKTDLEQIHESDESTTVHQQQDETHMVCDEKVGVSTSSVPLAVCNTQIPSSPPPPTLAASSISGSIDSSVTPLTNYDILPQDFIFKRLPTNDNDEHEHDKSTCEKDTVVSPPPLPPLPPPLPRGVTKPHDVTTNARTDHSSELKSEPSESQSLIRAHEQVLDNNITTPEIEANESDIANVKQGDTVTNTDVITQTSDNANLMLKGVVDAVSAACIQTSDVMYDSVKPETLLNDQIDSTEKQVPSHIEIQTVEITNTLSAVSVTETKVATNEVHSKNTENINDAILEPSKTNAGLSNAVVTSTNSTPEELVIPPAVVEESIVPSVPTEEGTPDRKDTPVEAAAVNQERGDDSSGGDPGDSLSSSEDENDRDGDMTLDDATDITLDDSTGSPVPPIPRESDIKQIANEEDEYFELARSGHYENVEYKKRPNALLISKRRLQALHPPRLGVVKTGLSRAWITMRGWGSEGARKINEWARESALLQDDEDATSTPAGTAHSSRATSELTTSPEGSPPPLQPRVVVPPRALRRRSGLAARHSRHLPHEGQSGFDELRRYMKQGGDFCKELSTILQERADAEAQYAKSLSKLSAKLSRSAKEAVGTVSAAWQQVAVEMEAEGEAHRDASAALAERVVRPLRATIEAQHRVRKSVESAVDKTGKGLAEWRVAEAKAKKHSFACARENERLQEALQEAQRLSRAGRTGTLSDKEVAKLESKRRKAEESVKKSDVEYYTFCIRSERARLEWETAVSRGSQCFQELEEQRLQHLKELVDAYLQLLAQLGPRIVQSTERLAQPVQECDISRDLHTVASIKGVGQPIPEQLLPDFYPEHVTLAMNRERRRLALAKLLQLIRQDLDRERRAKQGVENLARALQQTPTFGTEDSQQNVSDKLHHMRSMLTYLEAARYKVHGTLTELDGQSRASHPLASHIQVTRDRQGFQQSILKVPPWVREESLDQLGTENTDWPDRGAADGNSVQPDSDFDEFSSQASDDKEFPDVPVINHQSQCRALYDYTANLCDELNLRTGDVISVREKQDDGWWVGELNGVVGIFPATYVEEIDET